MDEVPDGYMRDSQGRLVPLAAVKAEHKLEDELVRDLFAKAEEASAALKAFRESAMGMIGIFLDLLADQYKAQRGGAKGNVTLSTYDGLLRIQLAIGDQLAFGPELQVAKDLVDACIREWSKGADENLQAVVNDAFNVDKRGKLNIDRILALRRLNIRDATWLRAMTAIGDAIRVERSKQYLRFYRRKSPDEKLVQLPLDLASV